MDAGKVAVIYLNSPKDLNSLSEQLKSELSRALTSLSRCPTTKVIVLLSKLPKAFCAGANIKEFTEKTHESSILHDTFAEISNVLGTLRKPLICGVNGVALGGGLEVVLHADIVTCSEDAKFGLPELKLGLMPGLGGTQRLAKVIGKFRTMKYVFTSDTFNAEEAKQMGLITDIFKKEVLHEETIKLAKRIAEKALATLAFAKDSIK